jgi:putative two-component system response regulator
VADAFDALTSERSYKRAWDMPHAVEVMRQDCGSHFDAACVDAFLRDLDAVRAIRERFPGE